MKKCDIVRDLIPLYADGEASEETAEYVREHIDSCPECKAYYNSCRHIPHASLGIVGKKRYEYSNLVRKMEIRKGIQVAAIAVITAAVSAVIYNNMKGQK